jgi:hypothetical protein
LVGFLAQDQLVFHVFRVLEVLPGKGWFRLIRVVLFELLRKNLLRVKLSLRLGGMLS